MNINHISVSRKKCFDLCAQQYKYRYHLKLASPIEEPIYFVYGSIVHKVAELYVENRGKVPIDDICNQVMRGEILLEDVQEGQEPPPPPKLPEDYMKKLTKHLRSIKNLTDKIGCDGLVEQEFKYDLDPPNGKMVTGFIDRLIIKDNKAFIIDYKTTKKGKFRVDANSVKQDIQLRMYARVVQLQYGIPAENIKAALYYLEGENLVAAQYNEESLIQVEQDLLKTYDSIVASDPDKVWGNVGWHCKQCEYCSLCPFYRGGSGGDSKWDGDLESIGHIDGWDAGIAIT